MKKLDMRGVAHDVVIIAFVAVFAIVGVAYLVASHADSCAPVPAPGDYSTPDVYKPPSESDSPVSGSNCPVLTPANSDTQKPTTPAGLAITSATANTIALKWTASKDNVGVAYYSIWRLANNATAYTQIAAVNGISTSPTLSYTDARASASTAYRYYVRAVDKANNISDISNTVSITTPAATPGALAAKCSITGVPQAPKYGQIIRPLLTTTNTGAQSFMPLIQSTSVTYDTRGRVTNSSETIKLFTLSPGRTDSQVLTQSNVPYRNGNSTTGRYTITSITNTAAIPKFSCSATFTLPIKPGTSTKSTI